ARWGEQCLVGSEEVVPALRAKRTLGLRRRLLGPGDELAAPAGVVLFELSYDAAMVLPERPLWIENPGATAAPAELTLYVKQPQG
ncbi:MAG: type VI secretion system baseplate subunit TssK, partial [Chloroflexota bacterium]